MPRLRSLILIGIAGILGGVSSVAGTIRTTYLGTIQEGLIAPTSIHVSADRIAVLEPFADRLLVYTAEGRLSRQVDFRGSAAGLVLLPNGDYAFCDRDGGTVIAVSSELPEPVALIPAETLKEPMDLCLANGLLWVLDAGSAEVVLLDSEYHIAGRLPLVDEEGMPLAYPASMAVYMGELFVFDQPTSRIHVYGESGSYHRSFSSFGAGEGSVTRGGSLRIDGRGVVYVADRFQGRIVVFQADGTYLGQMNPLDLGEEGLNVPVGLAVDVGGLLYVASTEGRRIDIFQIDIETGAGLPLAVAVSPTGDGIVPGAVVFQVEGILGGSLGPEAREKIVVDFRLWEEADAAEPLAWADSVATRVTWSEAEGGGTVEASWDPGVDLRENTVYLWSARFRDGDQVAPWAPSWSFRTAASMRVFRLEQNRPNPFHSTTTVVFHLSEDSNARLVIFDLQGREVWSEVYTGLAAGRHQAAWPGVDSWGRQARPGVYFYRLIAGDHVETRKMVLAR